VVLVYVAWITGGPYMQRSRYFSRQRYPGGRVLSLSECKQISGPLLGVGQTQVGQISMRCRLGLLQQDFPNGDVKQVKIRRIWRPECRRPAICSVLSISFLDSGNESVTGGEQITRSGEQGTLCSLRTAR
jgi:hypothetical protein